MTPSGAGSEDPSAKLPRWAWGIGGGVVASGAMFYLWILGTRPEKAFFWALMGDSVGPFAALLSAAALFAALYSVGLQRRELELQRAELRETREEMKAQREQFERTARAQERLAKAEEDLADIQGKGFFQAAQQLERQARANEINAMQVAATVSSAMLETLTQIQDEVGPGRPDTRDAVWQQRRTYIAIAETALEGALGPLARDLATAQLLDRVSGGKR